MNKTTSKPPNRQNQLNANASKQEIGFGTSENVVRAKILECLRNTKSPEVLERLISVARANDPNFNIEFRDELGHTLLGIAVKQHSMPCIELFVEKYDFFIKDELIMAVDINFKEAVEYFINHDPELVNRAVLTGTCYRPGVSPVMIASSNENEQMLKYLFSRGAVPLNVPVYNPRESRIIIRFDAILQTIQALSEPVYLCIMNEDPIMVAFKISGIDLFLFPRNQRFLRLSQFQEQYLAYFK